MSAHKQVKKYQNLQLEKVQHLNSMIEARKARTNNLSFRREILEKQKVGNYSSGYNRFRAHLMDSAIPLATRAGLKSRTEQLKSMGARAVSMENSAEHI